MLAARSSVALATQLWKIGEYAEAEATLDQAIALSPQPGWRIRQAALLPMVADSAAQIDALRQRMTDRLTRLLAEDRAIDDPAEQIAWTSYLLSYHGDIANRGLLQLFQRVCAQASPSLTWTAPHCRAPRRLGRLRVGFVSWYFCEHTVSRLFMGLIERLDPAAFDVSVFAIEGSDDALKRTDLPGKRTVTMPADLAAARQVIAAAELDVLVYLDLGMDPFTQFLAHARLARTQAVLWGHAETSGIPAIDFFLSCGAAEPEDGADHYSERLVRLPGIAAWVPRPRVADPAPRPADYGLPDNAVRYLCPQTPQKFHPDFDAMIARILRAVPDSVLVLTAGWARPLMDKVVRRLLAHAPDLEPRIFVQGPLEQPAFIGLMQVCDVILDPPYYSGGHTSLEALACGTPIVTWPGRFMRARHTYGFYRLMDMMDCVAADFDAYVDLAVSLGRDATKRDALRRTILARNSALYEDDTIVDAVAAFLTSAQSGCRL